MPHTGKPSKNHFKLATGSNCNPKQLGILSPGVGLLESGLKARIQNHVKSHRPWLSEFQSTDRYQLDFYCYDRAGAELRGSRKVL